MRRQLLTLHRALVAAVACGAFACGLDTSGLGDLSSDASPAPASTPVADATVAPTTADGSVGSDAAPPQGDDGASATVDSTAAPDDATPVPIDSAIPDAPPPDVHVLDPDASYPDSGDPCDLDQDGYKATTASCGGTDCCDFDSRAYPGEASFFTTPDACNSFDYDCNGTSDPEYALARCMVGFLTCSGDGFDKAPPACGVSAKFDSCAYALLTCSQSQSTVTQGCK